MATRIGILGYGNLGRGIDLACAAAPDMELVAVFTRRDPATVTPVSYTHLTLPTIVGV